MTDPFGCRKHQEPHYRITRRGHSTFFDLGIRIETFHHRDKLCRRRGREGLYHLLLRVSGRSPFSHPLPSNFPICFRAAAHARSDALERPSARDWTSFISMGTFTPDSTVKSRDWQAFNERFAGSFRKYRYNHHDPCHNPRRPKHGRFPPVFFYGHDRVRFETATIPSCRPTICSRHESNSTAKFPFVYNDDPNQFVTLFQPDIPVGTGRVGTICSWL